MSNSLYDDKHPNSSLKGVGFKDEKSAFRTIHLVNKRSPKYQFDVINTMYYRAKHHPKITSDMKKAMKIYKFWLKKEYPKLREQDYPFLPLKLVKKFENLADDYGVSEVARGKKKSQKSSKGFLVVYKNVHGKSGKLYYKPVFKNYPSGPDYASLRQKFIKSRLAQMKSTDTPFFYTDGYYKGLPTKQHLILIMHAYSPYPKILKKIAKIL